VTVMDFKTGKERDREATYLRQVGEYMVILNDIYPDRKIEGMIAYVELMQVRKLS